MGLGVGVAPCVALHLDQLEPRAHPRLVRVRVRVTVRAKV